MSSSAYEQDNTLQHKTLIVLGPYMPAAAERNQLLERASKIACLQVIEFDNKMEELIAGARAWSPWVAITPIAKSCPSTSPL